MCVRVPLLVVTSSYPKATAPWRGVAVQEQVLAAGALGIRVTVVHLDSTLVDDLAASDVETCEIEAEEATIRRLVLPTASRSSTTALANIWADALRSQAADLIASAAVVHAYGGMAAGAAAAAVVRNGSRLVVTEPGGDLAAALEGTANRASYAALLQRTDACLVPTRHSARLLSDALGAEATSAVQVAPPIVRTDRFPAPAARPRATRRWLHVGPLTDAAGLNRLVRAFAAYRSVDRDAVLTLVGEGDQRLPLGTTAARLGVADRIRFVPPGRPDELVALYLDHDVLVHLPRQEAFGASVLEAAAAGVGVVVTRCGGPEETLYDVAALGGVRFVAPGDDVVPVLEAVYDLAAGIDAVLPGADRIVAARFGPAAAGRRLARAYGDPLVRDPATQPYGPPVPSWPRVLLVDLDGGGSGDLGALAVAVSDLGGQPVVVTAGGAPPASAVPGAVSVDLRTLQRRTARAAPTGVASRLAGSIRRTAARVQGRAHAAATDAYRGVALVEAALAGPLAGIGRFDAAVAVGEAGSRLAAAAAPGTPVLAPDRDALVRYLATATGTVADTGDPVR